MKKTLNWLPCRRHFNKIARSMKITMVLLLAGALHLSAEVKAQTGVSLEMKNVSVQEVLNRLEQLTDYTFLYKMDLLEDCGKVDVSANIVADGALFQRRPARRSGERHPLSRKPLCDRYVGRECGAGIGFPLD